jgi:hypothetical protein
MAEHAAYLLGGRVNTMAERDRLLGSGIERSDEGERRLAELAELNVKAMRQGLDETESAQRRELQSIFSLAE